MAHNNGVSDHLIRFRARGMMWLVLFVILITASLTTHSILQPGDFVSVSAEHLNGLLLTGSDGIQYEIILTTDPTISLWLVLTNVSDRDELYNQRALELVGTITAREWPDQSIVVDFSHGLIKPQRLEGAILFHDSRRLLLKRVKVLSRHLGIRVKGGQLVQVEK